MVLLSLGSRPALFGSAGFRGGGVGGVHYEMESGPGHNSLVCC